MVISNSRKSGFFAELTTVLRHLKKVREENNSIYVDWNKNNSLYYDFSYGENVWEYFFNPIDKVTNEKIDYILNDYINITPIKNLNIRQTFNKLYFDNIKLNDTTQKIVDENIKIINKKTLGVHIRKTDKFLCKNFNEPMSFPVNNEEFFKLIDLKLDNNFDRIFLATDCTDTYEIFKQRYNNNIININRIRGNGVNSIHTTNTGSGYIKGLESILDSYILSNCGFLLRSTSNLSSFSMFLNTELECINLNEIYKGDIREHEFNIYSKI
jgi:hypothetical protein